MRSRHNRSDASVGDQPIVPAKASDKKDRLQPLLIDIIDMKISVFGNQDLDIDNAAIKLIPWLKKQYPETEIKIEDPAGGLVPPEDGEWLIVDTCAPPSPEATEGQRGIMVFEDLDKFEALRRVSVHDYEVMTELKLLKKLGKIKKLKILAVPINFTPKPLRRR